MKTLDDLTQKDVHRLFAYDSETGLLTRRIRTAARTKIGDVVGTPNSFGHLQVKIDHKLYLCHRLIWLYVYGEYPSTYLDHINGNPSDNRLVNLRLATGKQNQENVKLRVDSSSGYRGVNWNKLERKWVARVQHHKERIVVGKFDLFDDAITAIKTIRDSLYTHNKTEYAA